MRHFKNKLLAGLSGADLALLEPLEPCRLDRGQMLDQANQPIENVYFPESGIASVIALDEACRKIEVGPFGREGMSGTPMILGIASCPLETPVQIDGTAHRISAEVLRQALDESTSLRQRLLCYIQAFHIQTAQTLLVNSYATVEQRLARWLLMAHDRVDGPILSITHEFIAVMLGVRRAGVTEAVQMVEGRKFIKATRGVIEVQDRQGLLTLAGRAYGASEAEYARLLPS